MLLVLLLATSLYADETLDNAAVVRMVRAGLSIDVVMTKIAQSPAAFDTSVDALITLKSDGVPDPVIKAMLMKTPAAAAPAPASAPTPAPMQTTPPRAGSVCVHMQYYTLEARGWNWKQAELCANGAGIDVDEQNIPYERVTTHCFVLSALPRAEQEWWFSDGTDIHKFRARGNELQTISDFVSRTRSGIVHGSCGDRAVRKLLPAIPHE